ncbi:MAG: serine/threonine-protein kinase [Acidobacteriota bacterium]
MAVIDPQSPDHIGPYRLGALLAKGGMGEVYRGFDDRLKRPVALKRVRPGRRPEAVRRLRREARAIAQLRHEALIRIHDWVEDRGDLWLVMEFVEGRPLRQILLDEGPLRPAASARLGRQLAEGLAVAHDAGVIHRDLKPDNIMCTPGGGVRILDFGLVKPIDEEQTSSSSISSSISAEGEILGTVHYMSPEQAIGEELDGRSDLFSLGCLLYETLVGETPFHGANAVKTLHRLCNYAHVPLSRRVPGVSRELSDVVDRLLEKRPEDRPASASIVAQVLDVLETRMDDVPGLSGTAVDGMTRRDSAVTTDAPLRRFVPIGRRFEPAEIWLFGLAAILGVVLIWVLS